MVAATNMNMIQAVEKGKFREDLYYRLNSVPIRVPSLRDRKEDVPLLFRKFAGDCAERYMMPPITLTEEAKELLKAYRWPGNVRQLKNITEQISVIEQERVITKVIMTRYLPQQEVGMLPVLASQINDGDGRTFANEREILYQVLFDMKKDLNDLKQVVRDMLSKESNIQTSTKTDAYADNVMADESMSQIPVKYSKSFFKTPFASAQKQVEDKDDVQDASEYHDDREDVQDAVDYDDNNDNADEPDTTDYDDDNNDIIDAAKLANEIQSLQDAARDLIIKTLKRNGGVRRTAARDLQIAERTLYLNIIEYDLDDL